MNYSINYSKTSIGLWKYYRDDPNDKIVNSESFKFKNNIRGKTGNIKDVKIAVSFRKSTWDDFNQLSNWSHFNFVWKLCYFFCNLKNEICSNQYNLFV